MSVDQEVFPGKTLSNVFQDIYKNTESKREQINTYVKKLVQLIVTPEDAAMISPIIKEFLEVQVKSDEHLVRIAQIVQRISASVTKTAGDTGVLTDKEKEQLLAGLNRDIESLKSAADSLDDDLSSAMGS